jgi:hypothetical protein
MKYRKKPIIIEAEQYREGLEDGFEEMDMSKDSPYKGFIKMPYINTLEGKHYITPTDWIVTGIKGERYPVKRDIFLLTYEPIEKED